MEPRTIPPSPSFGATLSQALAAHPERCAVEGASWVLSYRDLDAEAGRLASQLRWHGVGSGHVVPLLLGRSPEFVVAALAVVRCGAAYAPIDLASPPGRRRAMLAQLSSPVWLVDATGAADDGTVPATVVALDVRRALQQPALPSVPGWPDTPGDTPLYVMFTSGTTGAPKGVVVPQRGVQRLVVDPGFARFGPDSRWGLMSSVAFDASTLELWGPLLNGGCCVVQEAAMPSLAELAAFMRRRTLTDAWLTSSLFNAMVEDQPDAFAGLQRLFTGGERVSPRHAALCLQAHPALQLVNGYGPTENTTFSLCHRIRLADTTAPELPIGRPVRGTGFRIAADDGRDVAPGQPGELWLCGDGLALGYLGDDERTRQRFVWHGGVRWYRSGDRVSEATGALHYHGRLDRQVKLQGHRVELDEIEQLLCACDGVDAAAVGVAGDTPENRHVVGWFASAVADDALPARIAGQLAGQLPAHMVPHPLHRLPRLPLNANGKVDRAALAALALPPAPAGAPRRTHPTEAALAEIWAMALGLPGGGAGLPADADFIALGGTSLLALKVAAEVRSRVQRALEPVDVLRHPRLAEQARCIDAAPPAAAGPAPAGPADVPLSRAQRAVLGASRLDPTGAAYLVHTALHVQGDAGPPGDARCDALREAMRELARRHPMLRVCLRDPGGHDGAVLAAELPADFWTRFEPLGQLPAAGHWPAWLLRALNRPLDLRRAPMRVDHWPLAGGGALLVWTAHHYVVDEATVERVVGEWATLAAGRPLAPVYGSAFSFASLEPAWHDAAGVRALAEAFTGPPLPAHAPPPPGPGAELPFALPPALAESLRSACAGWACTPFTPLAVACGGALQDTFGADARFVLAPFSRRLLPELAEPAGYLLDLRLLEAGGRPGEPLPATLERVHRQLVQAQQPGLQPAHEVAARLAEDRPAAAAALFRFAITWRQRAAPPGPGLQRLHVPQTAARFGLCLHLFDGAASDLADGAAPVEALLEVQQHAADTGDAGRFRDAFVARLQALLAAPVPRAPLIAAPAVPAVDPRTVTDAVAADAAEAWAGCLGQPPAGPEADFLAAGGTSLQALRLAARLRRSAGLELDVAAFLARPSFAGLCRSLRRPSAAHGAQPAWSLLGPQDFRRCAVLLPGLGGKAVSLFTLASSLRARLPPDHAVVMVDLHNLMQAAPPERVAAHLAEALRQLLLDLGPERIAGVAGYSLGGNLAAAALHALGPAQAARLPLVLVDSYANTALRTDAAWLWRRRAVKLLRHPWHSAVRFVQRRVSQHAEPPRQAHETPWLAARWDDCRNQLAQMPDGAGGVHAVLVHSRLARRDVPVLSGLDRNGYRPDAFGSLRVEALDVAHGDMVRAAADRVAGIIASHLRVP